MSRSPASSLVIPLSCLFFLSLAPTAALAGESPPWLSDRGPGIATSLFGTYVQTGELLLYPFYEYTWNRDQEYKPEELGYAGSHDQRGTLIEHEGLIFLAYGVSRRLALELESALIADATLHKDPSDLSGVPRRLHESGFGDTQAEIRWRWAAETASRPELWSYFEAVFPFQKNRKLIGTQDWELVPGVGATKGFGWGTVTTRISGTYDAEGGDFVFGEYALEYLKRLTPRWRLVLAFEGEQDEAAVIGELQWRFAPRALLKLNNGFGVTSKAPDIAPEVGVALSF
jgi:hypothetical protein